MFYSHEVLTSRKYGVATVWLVATLGSKSTLKKVSRKAILDVDVQKACETIVTPEAPMALRLQSNLLYGVARVYAQQCGYVLTDAEAAKNSLRTVMNVIRTTALDPEGGNKGRADQLLLQDDPNFLPDLDLVPMDLDQLDFDPTTLVGSQRSTLSPHSSQITIETQQHFAGLDILAQSESSLAGGPVGGSRGFNSVGGGSVAGTRLDADQLLDADELGITILPDGTMHMSDAPVRQPSGLSVRAERTDAGSASSRVRREHEGGQLGEDVLGRIDDDGFMAIQDDFAIEAGVEGFPTRDIEEQQPQQSTTSETADAPMRRRPRPAPKVIPADDAIELRNSVLSAWNDEYVANMQSAMRLKQTSRLAAIAKQNAEYWVLGSALGPLGFSDQGPLSMFSGANLLEALTGMKLSTAGEKHGRDDETDVATRRRVRPRTEPPADELGRGLQDDGFMPMMDETVEQGREAPTPLDDQHLSSVFPWNQSTGSRRPTGVFTSASFAGAGGAMLRSLGSRRGSRLVSASPLAGRGTILGDTGLDDELQLPGAQADMGMTGLGEDDFELFGPAAEVDTQTAAQTPWQRSALDSESVNFLAFVQAGIEQADQIRDQAVPGDEEHEAVNGSVDFETLLPPETNGRIVAAQALLHVLTLGTKSMLQVEQAETFGAIEMRVISDLQ